MNGIENFRLLQQRKTNFNKDSWHESWPDGWRDSHKVLFANSLSKKPNKTKS